MSSDVALSVRGVSKAYSINHGHERQTTLAEQFLARLRAPLRRATTETFYALRDVGFDVTQGEVLGVIGRNGAGKSTLLKVLSRITPPTTGEIHVYGRIGSLLEVGTGFHPELTGRENVFLNGAILGMRRDEIERHFDEIVEFAGVTRFLDTPVKRYSSGMYVRLAFAVAAHLSTDILLVDEVLAVGDLEFQRRCLGKMESLAEQGRTVIFVSHSMETVARLCRTALLLADGKVVTLGAARDTIQRYVADPNLTGTQRQWADHEAPGDDVVRLRAVTVEGRSVGGSRSHVDIRFPVSIRVMVGFSGVVEIPPLVSLIFRNAEGSVIFGTNTHHASGEAPQLPGHIVATCEIPGNLLAEGTHLVTVMLNSSGVIHIYQNDVVSFEVVDPGEGDSVRGDYTGDWAGYVRPMLPWKIENVVPPTETPDGVTHAAS